MDSTEERRPRFCRLPTVTPITRMLRAMAPFEENLCGDEDKRARQPKGRCERHFAKKRAWDAQLGGWQMPRTDRPRRRSAALRQ